jgi:hypothetical protein
VVGGLRRLYNVELHNLDTLQNIVKVITSKMTSWQGHITHIGKTRYK